MGSIMFMLAQQQTAQPAGNPLLMVVFMVVFIVFFYFVVIRPQNKQKKEMQNMLNALKKGDKIVTIGGIVGKVASIQDHYVTIRVNDSNTEITFEKGAIAKVVTPSKVENSNKNEKIEATLENQSKSSESKDDLTGGSDK